MAWFRFVSEKDQRVKALCDSMRAKLFNPDVLMSPFTGGVILKEQENNYCGFVKIIPTYPRLEYFWFLLSFIVLFWTRFQPGAMFFVFLTLGLFFTLFRVGLFYYFIFLFSLRKKGYKGKFRLSFKKRERGAFVGTNRNL